MLADYTPRTRQTCSRPTLNNAAVLSLIFTASLTTGAANRIDMHTTSQRDSLDDDDTLRNDILRGAQQIGRFVGDENERQTYHALESGHYPAKKIGGVWFGSKRVLTEHFTTPSNTPPPPDPNTEPTSTEAEAPPVIERRRLSPPRVSTDTDNDTDAKSPPTPRPPRAARSGRSAPRHAARLARR